MTHGLPVLTGAEDYECSSSLSSGQFFGLERFPIGDGDREDDLPAGSLFISPQLGGTARAPSPSLAVSPVP